MLASAALSLDLLQLLLGLLVSVLESGTGFASGLSLGLRLRWDLRLLVRWCWHWDILGTARGDNGRVHVVWLVSQGWWNILLGAALGVGGRLGVSLERSKQLVAASVDTGIQVLLVHAGVIDSDASVLGEVDVSGGTLALNLVGNTLGLLEALLVVGAALVDLGGVEVLVVGGLDAKLLLVDGELVPGGGSLLKGLALVGLGVRVECSIVALVWGPSLQLTLANVLAARYVDISAETVAAGSGSGGSSRGSSWLLGWYGLL